MTAKQYQPRPDSKSVIEMSAEEARRFFLKPQNYFTEPLPPFIKFDTLLETIAKYDLSKLREIINRCSRDIRKSNHINYVLYYNQDGKYAWRAFQLINPILYVNLVNIITDEKNWNFIRKFFEDIDKKVGKKIKQLSLPRESQISRIRDRGAEIRHWIDEVEQETVRLGRRYKYLYHTDISKFYPSIYTHTIAWALHGKDTAKKQRNDKNLLGNIIDKHIQDMQQGQTNGIPIGSALMNLIAEIILRYADLLVSEKIEEYKIGDYFILRYRDDYRIFVNEENTGAKILRIISEVLRELGLYLNDRKTEGPLSPIDGALKADKVAWLSRQRRFRNLQKHLLLIHQHGKEFPNGGSLISALQKVHRKVENKSYILGDPETSISILIDIGFENPRTFYLCISIISHLLLHILDKEDTGKAKKIVKEIVEDIGRRVNETPNNDYFEIWYQTLIFLLGTLLGTSFKCEKYNSKICNILAKMSDKMCGILAEMSDKMHLWDMTFLDKELVREDPELKKILSIIEDHTIFLNKEFWESPRPISSNEINVFNFYPEICNKGWSR